MKRKLFFFITLLIILSAVNCSDNIISECELCCGDVPAGKTTFADIQSTIFNAACIACHSGSLPSGGLNLSAGAAYGNLVNVASNGSALKRVEPFNSDASYLVKVLEGTDAPLMPPGAPLGSAKIDSVKAWIDRGAAND
ncbi:hypothetical protein JW998_12635 [candidate division KSB1 bacterium]|nr:hypothetical protein [candidate division KSB1 bacterium]